MKGRVPVGAGLGNGLTTRTIGDASGSETHTLTIDEMPSHTHIVPNKVIKTGLDTADGLDATNNEIDNINTDDKPTSPTGGGQPHNNMQPFLVLNYIIRY